MSEHHDATSDSLNKVTIQLHKEKLQVSKKWVETEEVTIYRNTFTEEKQITVPITCESLIIRKKILHPDADSETQFETIHIPISEERIEVTLHPAILNDIEIYKKQFEEYIPVNETLKEEKIHIDTVGDVKVRMDD